MTHGVLLCDKPAGVSSHAIVALARKLLGTSQVGHAGTLDPMATGLLVLAVGEGLKILRYLALDDKRYRATIRLGTETDSLDAEGVVTGCAALPGTLTRETVVAVCSRFTGTIVQQPPAISALKQGGVALYKRVRRGERVEPEARNVIVHALEVEAVREDEIDLGIHCGKGFYVRSLARDLAHALGTVGHLAVLRRMQSGAFHLDDAVPCVPALAAARDPALRQQWERRMLPIERALASAPRLRLDAEGVEHIRHGRPVGLERVLHAADFGQALLAARELEPVLLCSAEGQLLALARYSEAMLRVVRGLHC